MLRGTFWQLFFDISEETIGSTLNNQALQLEYKEEEDTVL
jgi:hypothetical protein